MTTFRIEQIKGFLKENQAAVISNDNNRFYFTGMTSSAGTVVITKGDAFAFYDFRYIEKGLRYHEKRNRYQGNIRWKSVWSK